MRDDLRLPGPATRAYFYAALWLSFSSGRDIWAKSGRQVGSCSSAQNRPYYSRVATIFQAAASVPTI